MNIFDPLVSGSLSVSGSAQISGSLTVLGGINANLSGTTATASYVEYNNVANKPTLISGSSQISGLGYAITGSNTFNGNQIITGSAFITTRVGINDNTPSYPLDIDGSNETAVIGVKYPISVTSNAVTRIRIDSTQATPNSGFGLYSNGAQKWSIAMFGATSDFTLYNDALLASALLIKGNSSNVLIGTTTDAGYKLDVNGTGRFTGSVDITGTVDVLTLRKANNVPGIAFIGTGSNKSLIEGGDSLNFYTGGASRLTIASTGAATFSSSVTAGSTLTINTPTSSTAIALWGRSSDNYSAIRFQSNTGATTYATIYSNASDLIFENNGLAALTINSTGAATFSSSVILGTSGNLRLSADASDGQIVAAFGKGLKFYTNDGNSNPLNLTSGGNVGIGTTSPELSLDIAGFGGLVYGGAGRRKYLTTDSLGNSPYDNMIIKSLGGSGGWRGAIQLQTSYNGGSVVNAMSIVSNTDGTTANVGIGTTSPVAKTHIYTDRYNDNLTFNSAAGFIIGGSIRQLSINTDDTAPYNISLQAKTNSSTAANIVLQSQGGNVLIGTTTDNGSKLQVNGNISSTSLVLSGNLNVSKATDSNWVSNYQNIINPNQLFDSKTYIIIVRWTITNIVNQPYYYSTSFLWQGTVTNGTSGDNEFTPIGSTHTGGTGATISFRSVAGIGNTSGLQARLNNFTGTPVGSLTVKAIQIE